MIFDIMNYDINYELLIMNYDIKDLWMLCVYEKSAYEKSGCKIMKISNFKNDPLIN